MRKLLLLNCFFVLCLIQAFASGSDTLIYKARILIDKERCNEAASIYEKILESEVRNYESNSFLGSYYFLLGKQAVDSADMKYKAIVQPNHMQMAHYQDVLKDIYYNDYEKAKSYLLKALEVQDNDHLNKTLAAIQAFKQRIGLESVKNKKKKK